MYTVVDSNILKILLSDYNFKIYKVIHEHNI